MLQKITTCPIAVTFNENLMTDVLQVMNKFRKYIVIKMDGVKPAVYEIRDATQPVLWVDQKSNNVSHFSTLIS